MRGKRGEEEQEDEGGRMSLEDEGEAQQSQRDQGIVLVHAPQSACAQRRWCAGPLSMLDCGGERRDEAQEKLYLGT